MRRFLMILLFAGFSGVYAQEVTAVATKVTENKTDEALNWYTDFNDAKREAEANGKPLMLFFTGSDWCGWCHRLENEVFSKEDFVTWANENVVLLELDFPRKKQLDPKTKMQNYYLQQKLGVRGYPTIWFMSFKKGEEKGVIAIDKLLGSTGYVRGGSSAWLATAEKILANK